MFKWWWKWAEDDEFVSLPATQETVILHLMHLMENVILQKASLYSSCRNCIMQGQSIQQLQQLHKKACEPFPIDNGVNQVQVMVARRRPPKPEKRKERCGRNGENVNREWHCLKLRMAVIIVIRFAGWVRWNDMENIKVEDITFYSDHIGMRLKKRKKELQRGY